MLDGVENNSDKVEEFYNILSDFKDPIPLADTCQLVMRNTPQLLEMLENVFNTLRHFELKRDQCVFNYALVQSGYPVSKVCITPNMPIGRPILNPGRGQFQKAQDAEKKVIKDILSLKSGKPLDSECEMLITEHVESFCEQVAKANDAEKREGKVSEPCPA